MLVCGNSHADRLDDYVKKQMLADHLPGISIAVVKNGKVVIEKSYGVENVRTNKPADAHTLYEIASLGKPFVAVATLKLVESGRIRLEDPVSKYLADTPKTWKTITIQNLLSHTSGIKDVLSDIPAPADKTEGDEEEQKTQRTADEFYHRAASQPLNFKPGAKYGYSHTNYIILGMILSARSARSVEKLLQDEIFTPLQMSDTQSKLMITEAKNRATGYRYVNGKLTESDAETGGFADQFLSSSIDDLVKWAVALDTGAVLTPEARALMWSPAVFTDGKSSIYGLGWNTESIQKHRVVGHAGSAGGFSAILTRFPDDNLTVIALTNQRDTNSLRLLKGIAAFYLPDLSQKND